MAEPLTDRRSVKWAAARRAWVRGAARADTEWVTLAVTDAQEYMPNEGTLHTLLFDLAHLRRPKEAAAFVGRYGLLLHSAARFNARKDSEVRERFSDWLDTAHALTLALRTYRLLRQAVTGDSEALGHLRAERPSLAMRYTPGEEDDLDDATLLRYASQDLAERVTLGLELAPISLVSGADPHMKGSALRDAPGAFAFLCECWTPRQYAYWRLSHVIAHHETLRDCADCGRPFGVTDARQRYCSTTCANRVRHQRWVAKRPNTTTP